MRATATACLTVVALATAAAVGFGQPAAVRGTEGERVFAAQGCYGCHMLTAYGTPLAPDLSRVGARYTEEQLARWLDDPQAVRPAARMPRLELTSGEIRALAAFLAAQRGS